MVMQAATLEDGFGRVHDSLRIGVTDRCNIRCFYCMPKSGAEYVERREILSFEEIERFARVAAALGVTKLRVTGGEPLARRDLPLLIRRLAAIPGVRDLALTTNGVLLDPLARPLYDAGLRRLNVHLDTLDRARFRQIARRDDLDKVLSGLEAARRAGFTAIKLNAVAMKNLTEPDIVPLARFGRERGFEVRYIEFMPLDAQDLWERAKSRRSCPCPAAIRARRPRNTLSPMASAKSVSSPPSAARSAATATGCGSPPMASCAIVCSRSKRTM
jgi:cyclic pyranopterin phosphate synthase